MKIKKMFFGLTLAAVSVGAIAGVLAPSAIESPVGAAEAVEPLANGQVILRLEKNTECILTDEKILETVYVHNWNDGGGTDWNNPRLISTFNLKAYDEGRWTFTLKMGEETSGESHLRDKFILRDVTGNIKTPDSQWIGLDATHEYVLEINADGSIKTGEWKKVAQPFTSNMLRLWVNTGSYGGTEKQILLNVWGDLGAYKSLPTDYAPMGTEGTEGSTFYMPYFDVPKSAITENHVQFQQISPQGSFELAFNHNELGEENTYAAGDNAQIYFLWTDEAGAGKFSQGSFGTDESLSATFIKPVLEGYFACLDDVDNGYANWDRVKQTWISYTDEESVEHWIVTGELSSVELSDFATEADYVTGNRTATTNAWTKVQQMDALWAETNAQSPLFGVSFGNMDNGIIIAVVTLLSVVSVSAIVFISMKRRHSKKN